MASSGRVLPICEERDERDEKDRCGQHETTSRRPARRCDLLFHSAVFCLTRLRPFFAPDDVRELLPEKAEADGCPNAPRGVTPDVEVVAVANLTRDVSDIRILRP